MKRGWIRQILAILFVAQASLAAPCERIVSLAPSVTQIIDSLNLGSKLVGISRFCARPQSATDAGIVGGFLDPDFESILNISPSEVFVLTEFGERIDDLRRLNLNTVVLNNNTVAGILQAIEKVGVACDVQESAKALLATISSKRSSYQSKSARLKPVKTLIVVGTEEVGTLKSLYVSGKDGFYDEILRDVGGINVVEGNTRSAVAVSIEGIIALAPQVIIEIHPDAKEPALATKLAKAAWKDFTMIPAVNSGRIFVLTEPYSYIPGPTFPQLMERMAAIIHPEVF